MNWKEIKKKYPKAFKKLNEWYGIDLLEFNKQEPKRYGHYFTDGVHGVLMWNDFDIRDLYDFFDEQGIIFVPFFADCPDKWGTYIWNKKIGGIQSPYKYKSRKEAKEVAFLKEFKILENELNENQ